MSQPQGVDLFVRGFPLAFSNDDLKKLFRPFHLVSCHILRDKRTGVSRRIGFVKVQSPGDAQAAISALDGKNLQDAVLDVEQMNVVESKEAKETKETSDKLAKLFPRVPHEQRHKLRVDAQAIYSVTPQDAADQLSAWIRGWMPDARVVTDGTACAGGNTLSFVNHFERVIAVEFDPGRFHDLAHNMRLMGVRDKCQLLQADYTQIFATLQQDVIFLDAPWGGPSYKTVDKLRLYFGAEDAPRHEKVPLTDVCRAILRLHLARLLVLKVPLNFDFDDLASKLSSVSLIKPSKLHLVRISISEYAYVFVDMSGIEVRDLYSRIRALNIRRAIVHVFVDGSWRCEDALTYCPRVVC